MRKSDEPVEEHAYHEGACSRRESEQAPVRRRRNAEGRFRGGRAPGHLPRDWHMNPATAKICYQL